ncbi:MAG: methyltransferase domain-containing protein [Gemmatimonadota bacterium]|jgi:SAM-dependent methyltransferase
MDKDRGTLRLSFDVALEPAAAFDALVAELVGGLRRAGIAFEAGPDGRVTQDDVDLGRVVAWEPGGHMRLRWRPAPWQPDAVTEVEARVEPADHGARLIIEHRGWGALLEDGAEAAGWFAMAAAAALLHATTPAAFGDWYTDRHARRPSGPGSSAFYRDPLYHRPYFRAILDELALTPDDRLLDIGCGGGAFLHDALASGCRGAGIDHSPEMVRVARRLNADAIGEGRLEIIEGGADRLPFPDDAFTCAAMTGVLGFLPDPVRTLTEIRRTLAPGGRVVVQGFEPELKGTPAAPEPMASRLNFYDDEAFTELARAAGFADVRVIRRNVESYARDAGVPDEHLPLFAGAAPFLVARKAGLDR